MSAAQDLRQTVAQVKFFTAGVTSTGIFLQRIRDLNGRTSEVISHCTCRRLLGATVI